MMTKRKQMTEDMKAAIRQSAAELFAEKGYQHVTMREIAKQAGCSHTAIYLYFKNKEELLQQIAIPSLLELDDQFRAEMAKTDASPYERLAEVCSRFVVFCLSNGSLQTVLFITGSVRVDDPAPALEINVIRNRLFGQLRESLELAVAAERIEAAVGGAAAGEAAIGQAAAGKAATGPAAHAADAEAVTNRARVLFYYLQGFVSTYTGHSEPTDVLLPRVLPIFKEGIAVLVRGMRTERQD